MNCVSLHLSRPEADSLLDLVAWARYHSNGIYPQVGSIDLFKAHMALEQTLAAAEVVKVTHTPTHKWFRLTKDAP